MARIDNLSNFLLDVANSIRTKKGTSDLIEIAKFDTEILSIPSGGGEVVSKDVNFYDYDGTILYSYTKADFLELTEMPANPTHTGLTSLGWNWTLSDAQTFLADKSFVDIGQVYEPTDGETKIYVSITKSTLTPTLSFATNGTTTIDWGDDSTPDTITGTDLTTIINTQHTYSTPGDYVISIGSTDKVHVPLGDSNYGEKFFWGGVEPLTYYNRAFTLAIKKLIFSNIIDITESYSFRLCQSLESVILPTVLVSGAYLFYGCSSLKHVTIPNVVNYSLPSSFFISCNSLKSVSISSTTIKLNAGCLANNQQLTRVSLPNSITSMYSSIFSDDLFDSIEMPNNLTLIRGFSDLPRVTRLVIHSTSTGSINLNSTASGMYSLTEVIILCNVYRLQNQAFANNYACLKYDFTHCTAVPLLSSTNVFNKINANCKIIVPDSLYNSWIAANNWSTYASYIVKESEA